MAQLKDTVVSGSLRATDSVLGNTGEFKVIRIPTTSNTTVCGPGTDGQVILSNGTNAYWGSNGVTSVTITATTPVVVSSSAAITSTGSRTISLADAYGDTKNPYGTKTANYVLAAPNGSNAAPGWRKLVNADMPAPIDVPHGGTGVTTITASSVLMSGSNNTAAITTRAVTNNTTSSTAIAANTNFPTMNTVYNGIVRVNNDDQKRTITIYAPTGGGTANYLLSANGATSTPTWRKLATSDILDLVYPIGSIYMSVSSTSPGELFGGTWAQLEDRFLLGVGTTYTITAENNGIGGAAEHTLTTEEMPSHNHTFTGTAVTSGDQSQSHTHTFTSNEQNQGHQHWVSTGGVSANHRHWRDNHSHSFRSWKAMMTGGSGPYWLPAEHDEKWLGSIIGGGGGWSGYIEANHSHSCWSDGVNQGHTHTGTTNNANQGHTHSVTAEGTIGNTGGGLAHNNMPPYLMVYMWKRTG